MAFFPMFVDLEGKNVLIVGGGRVAARKVEKLLPFGCRVTVVSGRIREEIHAMGVQTLLREFCDADITGRDMVIAATDDPDLNTRVCNLAKGLRIPVNSVDDKKNCTFLFPALVKRGKLTVGVCSSGASPSAAKWVKMQVEDVLPDKTEDILEYLDDLRGRFPAGTMRQEMLGRAFEACMRLGRPLTEEEEADL